MAPSCGKPLPSTYSIDTLKWNRNHETIVLTTKKQAKKLNQFIQCLLNNIPCSKLFSGLESSDMLLNTELYISASQTIMCISSQRILLKCRKCRFWFTRSMSKITHFYWAPSWCWCSRFEASKVFLSACVRGQ